MAHKNNGIMERWASCLIGDIAVVVGGGTPKTTIAENFAESAGIPWITPADLRDYKDVYIEKGKRQLSTQGLRLSSSKLLPKGTVLFSSRAPIGYVAIARNPLATNQGFRSFICLEGIVPEYVYYYLKYAKPIAEGLASGTTFPEISGSNAAKIPIIFPPTNEQHRIVAKLEKLLAKVDNCKERLEKVPAILKRFRQSILAAACSGELTKDWRKKHRDIETSEGLLRRIKQERENHKATSGIIAKKNVRQPSLAVRSDRAPKDEPEIPETWSYALSFDLFTFVTSGSRGWAKYYAQEGAKFIRIGNLAHDTIDLNLESVQYVVPPEGSEGLRTRIRKNDILVSITADTGMIGLIQYNIGEAYINQHVALSRPTEELYAKYLAWFLASKEGQRQFKALQRGATKVGLRLEDIKNVWVPLPPIAEQHEIVNRVEALFKIADEIEARYQKAKNHINHLTQSILAKAFRGGLVPQNSNDEPASELLKRIKTEREQGQKDKIPLREGKLDANC